MLSYYLFLFCVFKINQLTFSIKGILKGGIDFTGKVGDLVAYNKDGETRIQTKGGATKEKIYTDPAKGGNKE